MKTIFENNQIVVVENGSGEIIVKDKSGNSVRVSPTKEGLFVSNASGEISVYSVCGVQGVLSYARNLKGI